MITDFSPYLIGAITTVCIQHVIRWLPKYLRWRWLHHYCEAKNSWHRIGSCGIKLIQVHAMIEHIGPFCYSTHRYFQKMCLNNQNASSNIFIAQTISDQLYERRNFFLGYANGTQHTVRIEHMYEDERDERWKACLTRLSDDFRCEIEARNQHDLLSKILDIAKYPEKLEQLALAC